MNASDRLNTCKSRGSMGVATRLMATGALVSNTYATCLLQGDNPEKFGLIPHSPRGCMAVRGKLRRKERCVGVLRGRSPTLVLRHGPDSYGRQQ